MKKLTTTAIATLFAAYGYAQNTFPYPENADVGIGTNTPSEKLDVNGNINWNGYNSGNARALKLGYSGGNYGGLGYNVSFTPTTGIFNRPFADQSSYLELTYGGFRFYGTANATAANGVNLGGGGTNLNLFATLDRVGNFGLGTASPTYKMEVHGGSNLLKLVGNNSTSSSPSLDIYDSVHGTEFVASTSAGKVDLFAFSNHPLSLGAANAEKMRIMPGGNVGIGTTNPQMAGTGYTGLDIRGDIGSSVILGTPANIGAYVFASNSDFYIETPGFMAFRSGGQNERFRVTSDGKMGIGTSTPTEMLSVNGKIRAKEIKVEAAPWPDYVFNSSYKLPDLKVTEQYIKENKHLPEIPSAAQVANEGVSLGEMNALLLKKIEELTLYLIDQSKDIAALKKSNEELKSQILKITQQ